MRTANEIKTEIEALPHKEYVKLVSWLTEKDWGSWDKQIEEDSQSGSLDFLIDEALNEKATGNLKEI